MADEHTQEFRDEVLDWMELRTKDEVFAAVAHHDAALREQVRGECAALARSMADNEPDGYYGQACYEIATAIAAPNQGAGADGGGTSV